jgi:hypothetical protein
VLAASVTEPTTEEEQRAYAYTGNFFRDTLGAATAAGDSGAATTAMTAPLAFFADPTGVFNLTKDADSGITSIGVTPGDKSTLLGAARQSVTANGPFNPGLAIGALAQAIGTGIGAMANTQIGGIAGAMASTWTVGAAAIGSQLTRGNFMVGNTGAVSSAGGSRRQALPEEAPRVPQATGYMYLPGYRPSAQPGQQFWLPELPGGQQFWVAANMIASGDEYRDPDWLNNPQYDPNNPEGSLRRMEEVYGPLQPVPVQLLRTEGAYMGKDARTSYDQPRTILTGMRALGVNPYGLTGEGGMMQTQGAPDPRTQPELYAKWQEEVMRPRGEYGIWMESPIQETPNATFQQTGTGLSWQTKPRTPVTVTAPGMVVAVTDTPQYGKVVIVQHDFGQTIYSGLASAGAVAGQYLATGDLIGLSGENFSLGMQLAGKEGWTDPLPYMPSTGERGESGWSLLDVAGINREKAQMLVDMGYRTPEDLRDRGTAAAIDQHPVFGKAFDAQESWNIMAAVNALLDSGPNPNPPISEDQSRIPPSQRVAVSVAGQPAELPVTPAGSAPVATRAAAPGGQAAAPARTGFDPQITAFAAENDIDPALMQAVLNVESGGQGMNADGSLKLRLEVQQLFKYADTPEVRERFRSNGNYDEQYLSDDGEWNDVHGSQANEQEAYALAVKLAGKDAASTAISMGAPQIMGFHADDLGYESAGAMYDAFATGQDTQIAGFLNFVGGNARMMDALQTGDIGAFAGAYNPGAKTLYTERMTDQYNAITATGATAAPAQGATAGSGATTSDAGADDQQTEGATLVAGMLPGLTETRLANLLKRSEIKSIEEIAALTAGTGDAATQDEAWLGKTLGFGDKLDEADLEEVRDMINAAQGYQAPGPETNIQAHPYLFATDMTNPVTGTNISEDELRRIMLEGKAHTFADLAAADPKQLVADAKITRSQADAAIEIARGITGRQAPETIQLPDGGTFTLNAYRTLPRTYAEIEAPPPSGPTLFEEMIPGLTQPRIEALAKAGITTIGQLKQVGAPANEDGQSWSPDWLRARTEDGITVDIIKDLATGANAYKAPDETTRISPDNRGELDVSMIQLLKMQDAGIYTLGDLATTDPHWLRDTIPGFGEASALGRKPVEAARQLAGMRMATDEEKSLRDARGITLPGVIYETDPTRTETRYPFRKENAGIGVEGISAQREALLYSTAPTKALAESGEVIDTAKEFTDADPDWLYEASSYKWSIQDINKAQNALRSRLKLPEQTLSGSRYAEMAQQDLTTLGITPDQVKKLAELNIIDYGSLIAAPENLNGQIGEILKYDPDQVSGLRNQASTQMDAIKAKQGAEPQAEPAVPEPAVPEPAEGVEGESVAPAAPLAEKLTEPVAASTPKYAAQASFLGVDPSELAGLTPEQIQDKVNDRMSLYNQKQMGSGDADRGIEQFQQRYDMGASSLEAVAERTSSVTDRRQAIRIDQPLATSRRTPVAVSNRTGVDMKQIAGMVQQMIGDMEPRFASRIYRQLEQGLYA